MTRHPNLLCFLVLAWVSLISIATNSHAQNVTVEPGVSLSLATQRKALLADINYRLRLEIPADQRQTIVGSVRVEFDLADAGAPLQLDFREAAQRLSIGRRHGNVRVPIWNTSLSRHRSWLLDATR
ncbi:MAG: hypothetical protein ACE37N_09590 [Pseudohongiellaceae bacterium]